MDLNKIYLDLSEKKYTDAEINLVDNRSSTKLSVHKVILGLSSLYFDRLFNFPGNKNKSHFDIQVNDCGIAHDIILSFYGKNINSTDYPDWKYIFETFSCRSFFGLENDVSKLDKIKFPPEGFDQLIQTADELNLLDDKKVIKIIKKNIPENYDLSVFSKDFIKELLSVAINRKQYIVSGSVDQTINIYDIETGLYLNPLIGHTETISSLVISTDNTKIISGSGDETIKIWDIETRSCLKTLYGHNSYIRSVAVSSDNTRIVSSDDNGKIRIWDMKTGSCSQTLSDYGRVYSVVLSNDNKKIISVSNYTIKIWDIETGSYLNKLYAHDRAIYSIAISNDDAKIISASLDKTIKIWDMETGSCLNTLSGHNDWVRSVVLSSDNTKIISGSDDKTIKIWDMKTGSCLKTLIGHTGYVRSVAILNDDTKIISGSQDETIKIWDAETGTCLDTLTCHTNAVTSIFLIPNILSYLDKKLKSYCY